MPKPSVNIEKQAHYYGHRQRLKKRFLESPQSVPDYELLELILYWVYPRRDVKPEAKALLEQFRTLNHLIHEKTIKPHLFFAFQVVKEIARRLLLEEIQNCPVLSSTKKVIEYCRVTIGFSDIEQFRIFFLDKKYILLQEDAHQMGTIDQVSLYPREVLKKALACNASHLILVHNHPSGDTTPSHADIDITNHLKSILLPFNIRILDHFIIGRFGHFSFRQKGLLT